MCPFIEKSGSTTLDTTLSHYSHARGGHNRGHCACEALGMNATLLHVAQAMVNGSHHLDGRCCLSGTFQHSSEMPGLYRFAIVRDPLDRFLSAVRPHTPFRLCHGKNKSAPHAGRQMCEEDLMLLRSHAAALAGSTDRSYRVVSLPGALLPKSVHWYTQSYFLSATDAAGNPYRWDFIGHLERLEQALGHVATHFASLSRALPHLPRKNAGNGENDLQVLRRAALDDPGVACHFCHVHAQDYACLGYRLPVECTYRCHYSSNGSVAWV